MPLRKLSILSPNKAQERPKKIKNVVVFGETGVGKSSLINLIAGQTVSQISNAAARAFSYQRHLLKLGDQRFAIWDTAGLDEDSQGTIPAEKAEAYLKRFLRNLSKAGGVDLLIYCVRGTGAPSALLTNYHLFYSAICRRKVPVAIVITGLENQGGNMDTWWSENKRQFSALQMHFDDYACVTTLQPSMRIAALEERRRSRETLIKLIANNCRTEQWMPAERSWVCTAFSDAFAILSSKDETQVANAIMCDISRHALPSAGATKRPITFQTPVTLSRSSTWKPNFRSPIVHNESQSKLPFNVSIRCTPERLLRVHQVPRKQVPYRDQEEGTKKNPVVKRGADLLIFCAEKGSEGCEDVKAQWEHFNLTYGGDLSPQVVVVVGATDQQSAKDWWNSHVLGIGATQPGASIAYWPIDEPFAEIDAKARLRDIIDECCIDCSKEYLAGVKRMFLPRTLPHLDKTSQWARLPAGNGTVDKLVTDLDVLTEWGVWEHVPTETEAMIESDTTDIWRLY